MSKSVDFLIDEYTTARRHNRWARIGSVLMAAVVVGAVGLTFAMHVRIVTVRAQLEPLQDGIANMRGWEESAVRVSARFAEIVSKQQLIGRLEQGTRWEVFLSDVAASVGEDVWLTQCDIRYKPSANSEQELTTVALEGEARYEKEIIALIANLKESSQVEMLQLQSTTHVQHQGGPETIRFQLAGLLRGR